MMHAKNISHTPAVRPSFGINIQHSKFLAGAVCSEEAGLALVKIGKLERPDEFFVSKQGEIYTAGVKANCGRIVKLASTEETPLESLIALAWKRLDDGISGLQVLKKDWAKK